MELKVGDFVRTEYGVGELLVIIPEREYAQYIVGIKGFDGHNATGDIDIKKLKRKGYVYQCYYFNEEDLEKLEDPSILINEEFDEPKEMVNHLSHYNQGKREVIEEMRIMFGDEAVESFCRLNAYKYMRRAEFKGNKKEDLDKAEWYMDYLEMMRGEK